jgi:hypothetical protein
MVFSRLRSSESEIRFIITTTVKISTPQIYKKIGGRAKHATVKISTPLASRSWVRPP